MSSDSSSLPSTTGGSSSISSSPSATSGTTPLFSQSFTVPPPSTTDGGNNGGGGGFNSPSIASSASLYLYTFLATLVLLLSVSAAIILRSLLLRRRHRRMVEEAIRNGTWIPPPPGGIAGFGLGGRSVRVDINSKPKMWEAYVEKNMEGGGYAKGYSDVEWDWDSIRPFSATVVTTSPGPTEPTPISVLPVPEADSVPAVTTNTSTNLATNERAPFTQRIRQFINPTPFTTLNYPRPEGIIPPHSDDSSSPNVNQIELPSGPQTVRVSVLIAMPSQSRSQPSPIPKSPSPPMIPPSPSSSLSMTPSMLPTFLSVPLTLESSPLGQHRSSYASQEKEDELPHLEVGVADFMVREDGRKENVDTRIDAQRLAQSKRPLSMGSSMDAV